ncbi:MAG: hypothetical protein HOM34_04110 [Planctomycetes bacterium]|jgi:hypothetical protein|nr:hypothetical protein [Planctomycetota bacterium]MBT4029474.1 hypothetical protein [Planctomycetota bacterium]MBT4560656.1 hypothetical protein [Planctomycetota bacterium]MBT5119885.1 hypothetical protein [Planctomycetota bacterium]MBT7317720.1 hypothetical protein [Planctomycetota bacterium]
MHTTLLLSLLALPFFAQPQEECCQEKLTAGEPPCCAAEEAPLVEEPATDEMFAKWLILPMGQGELAKAVRHDLAALAVRKKFIFKVYGFGLYFDSAAMAADAELKKAAGDSTLKELKKDKDFHQAMLSDSFGKSLAWTMVRDVDAEDIGEAFDDQLEPRLESKTKDKKELTAAKEALGTFAGYFSVGELTEGTTLLFYWEPGGRLHTWIDGKKKGVIESTQLCWALFDVYLGDGKGVVSSDARDDAVAAVHAALNPQVAATE